jgi:SHS2 domain-containing protein
MNYFQTIPDFEEIPHKADAALIVYGHSISDLFIHAVKGMYHIMGIVGEGIQRTEDVIEVQASDHETMLVSFLTELLFLTELSIFPEIIELRIKKDNLKSRIYKTQITSMAKGIKAVTFNEMMIIKKDNVYQTKIVFDL